MNFVQLFFKLKRKKKSKLCFIYTISPLPYQLCHDLFIIKSCKHNLSFVKFIKLACLNNLYVKLHYYNNKNGFHDC